MAASATATATPEHLAFARSQSKTTGILTPLKKMIPESIREACHRERELEYNNAPRIIGVIKTGMDVTIALSGNPWWIGYAVFAITGRMISIAWGSKKHQQKLAKEKEEGLHQKELGHSFRANDRKILHPREYPVEASAGMSVVAESFGLGFGISQFLKGATGYTAIVTELIALWSYGNIVFHKEKKKGEEDAAKEKKKESDPLVFEKSQSKPAGIMSRFRQATKNNPVLVSSLANISLCTIALVGGVIEGYGIAYVSAFVIGGFANALQALLVRKNDYNIEGANQGKTETNPSATFQERVAANRRGGDLGMKPA